MTNVIKISWKKGSEYGSVNGVIATHTLVGSKYRLVSIDYRIVAKTISEELKTNKWTVTPEGGAAVSFVLPELLPNETSLVETLDHLGAGTIDIQRAVPEGWTIKSVDDKKLSYSPSRILKFLGVDRTPEKDQVIRLDPRFGAMSQTLVLGGNRGYSINLPLAGDYLDVLQIRPFNETVQFTEQITTATIETFYPSINTVIVEKPEIDIVFTMLLQKDF